MTESGAYRAVKRAMERAQEDLKEDAKELIYLENARLDVMLKAIWPDVLRGDREAITLALKIRDKRAALFGLDAQPGAGGGVPSTIVFRWEREETE